MRTKTKELLVTSRRTRAAATAGALISHHSSRRAPTEAAGDFADPEPLCMEDGALLSLGEGEVAARHGGHRNRRHPASLHPLAPDRGRISPEGA